MQSTQFLCHMLGAALAAFISIHDARAQTDVSHQQNVQLYTLPAVSH